MKGLHANHTKLNGADISDFMTLIQAYSGFDLNQSHQRGIMANHWLMKSEPDVFGISHLQQVKTEPWDGVRNYQARNFMRDQMQVGDQVFMYHSNAKPPGVAGIMEVASLPYPDPTQFDPNSKYFDPKASKDKPRWFVVDVSFVAAFNDVLGLDVLKTLPELDDCPLTQRGNRLSIMPLTQTHWQAIIEAAKTANLYS